jgi:hypothetical protein
LLNLPVARISGIFVVPEIWAIGRLDMRILSRMSDRDTIRQRTLEAAHLQMIEGNPLDAEQVAMFEMFDREGWSPERQRAYILERARAAAAQQAAE